MDDFLPNCLETLVTDVQIIVEINEGHISVFIWFYNKWADQDNLELLNNWSVCELVYKPEARVE